MINNRRNLRECILYEKKIYFTGFADKLIKSFLRDKAYYIFKYQVYLRKSEYFHNNKKKILYAIYRKKKNKLGIKLGFELWDNSFDIGLKIHHPGYIVVNGNCKIGKNCTLFGCNCIGNNGKDYSAPVIGDNVSIGFGASVFGDIYIANNVFIGAGAVVLDSIYEEGKIVVGIPAHVKE